MSDEIDILINSYIVNGSGSGNDSLSSDSVKMRMNFIFCHILTFSISPSFSFRVINCELLMLRFLNVRLW